MNVTLKVDVLTPENGVGRAGQSVSMSDDLGKQYIAKGLATEAAADAEVLPPDPKPTPAQPVTRDTLKEDKAAAARDTKPTGPAETKATDVPTGTLTAATLNAPPKTDPNKPA